MNKLKSYAVSLYGSLERGVNLVLTDPFEAALSVLSWVIPAAIGIWLVRMVGAWALNLIGVL